MAANSPPLKGRKAGLWNGFLAETFRKTEQNKFKEKIGMMQIYL